MGLGQALPWLLWTDPNSKGPALSSFCLSFEDAPPRLRLLSSPQPEGRGAGELARLGLKWGCPNPFPWP